MNRQRLKTDLGKDGALPLTARGERIKLTAVITYPGHRTTTLMVGGQEINLPNDALRRALS